MQKAHTVIIDKTLLEENQEHRYRFTMGHEAGHEFLHKEYFAYDPDQITLFDLMGETPAPMVQCRVDTKKMDCRTSKSWTDKGLDGMAGKCVIICSSDACFNGTDGS